FFRQQLNGEKVKRDWLCYSPFSKRVYCFMCKLFAFKHDKTMMASVGYCDWKHAPRDLARHESSESHIRCLSMYISRKAKTTSICKDFEKQNESDRKYWCKVLSRVLSVIKFLSSRGLISLSPEHIQKRVNKGRGHVSYFSSTVCEEFIDILAKKVLNFIISEIKQAKYYSVSVDSTPDITNVDQLTIVIRYVLPDGPVERFVQFVPIRGHTGSQLAQNLLDFIEDKGISLKDLRGQSYDNAYNMSGKYKGMQAVITEHNHLAEYIPCVALSLNLVGKCAAECCQSAPLSNTRWSARHDAINALRKGYQAILQVLQAISDDEDEQLQTKQTAKGFILSMEKLETGILLELWSCVLERFHKTSQALQDSKMTLNTATNLLQGLETFVQTLRQFKEFEEKGKVLSGCSILHRKKKRKVRLEEQSRSEGTSLDSSSRFKVESYLLIIDQILLSMKTRIAAYDHFSFVARFKTMTNSEIQESAKTLLHHYSNDLEESLPEEMIHFSALLKQHNFNRECSIEIQNLMSAFPNVSVVLRIYLCLMISNCSGERSFSVLKRVKNHLRSSMSQQRLNSLALLCIENEILTNVDTRDVIKSFALTKSRK
uniref:TTF-type domain-containing protein n=1 Tax=Ciona savignyi TaxID=51511 RepID=H2YAF9_CIOSA